jgi:hypothetical protein
MRATSNVIYLTRARAVLSALQLVFSRLGRTDVGITLPFVNTQRSSQCSVGKLPYHPSTGAKVTGSPVARLMMTIQSVFVRDCSGM